MNSLFLTLTWVYISNWNKSFNKNVHQKCLVNSFKMTLHRRLYSIYLHSRSSNMCKVNSSKEKLKVKRIPEKENIWKKSWWTGPFGLGPFNCNNKNLRNFMHTKNSFWPSSSYSLFYFSYTQTHAHKWRSIWCPDIQCGERF